MMRNVTMTILVMRGGQVVAGHGYEHFVNLGAPTHTPLAANPDPRDLYVVRMWPLGAALPAGVAEDMRNDDDDWAWMTVELTHNADRIGQRPCLLYIGEPCFPAGLARFITPRYAPDGYTLLGGTDTWSLVFDVKEVRR